jgi:hypothetical protein
MINDGVDCFIIDDQFQNVAILVTTITATKVVIKSNQSSPQTHLTDDLPFLVVHPEHGLFSSSTQIILNSNRLLTQMICLFL